MVFRGVFIHARYFETEATYQEYLDNRDEEAEAEG